MQTITRSTSNFCVQLLGILSIILFASSSSFAQSEGGNKPNELQWGYLGVEGPEHWGLLSKKYVTCETGSKQSPIDIRTQGRSHRQEALKFNYKTSELHEVNNGHTIQVSHKLRSTVDINDRTYHLRQFHFHDPSEHHINGKKFPMEMHLVHQDETGHLLVIAVLMETGSEHPVFEKILGWLPEQIGAEASVPMKGSLQDILPKSFHHYTYSGSLTTPPCSEGVKWLVFTESIEVSEKSLNKFSEIIGYNARPIQPLGNRQIELN